MCTRAEPISPGHRDNSPLIKVIDRYRIFGRELNRQFHQISKLKIQGCRSNKCTEHRHKDRTDREISGDQQGDHPDDKRTDPENDHLTECQFIVRARIKYV